MLSHNWLTVPTVILLWVWTSYINLGINGQSQNAIGAHRLFQKTSFSCAGRPAGYYADIETGCQVYHMCDGLGRQFSYSCPNTTLFQQRMLICDHWYMVNCSKAESNYAANLLIGQRDKPFVNDEENNLRTPRPDLLDRPYAPDYSGESFRNQYKHLSVSKNQIHDSNEQKTLEKTEQSNHLAPGQQRWKIPPPSRTILPPAYEPQIEEAVTRATKSQQNNVRFVSTTKVGTSTTTSRFYSSTTPRTKTTTTTTTRRPTAPAAAPNSRKQSQFTGFNNAALHQRHQESVQVEHDDLGTSHSTRYNTSADFNTADAASKKTLKTFSKRKPIATAPFPTTATIAITTKQAVKVPSKIYEPPFLYPIYNQDDTPSTETPLVISTAAPFTAPSTARTRSTSTTTTTTRPPSRPTTLAGKPFTIASSATPIANSGRNKNNLLQQNNVHNSRYDSQKHIKDARTPTPAQGFKPPTPRPPVNSSKTLKPPKIQTQKTESSAFDYKIPSTGRLNIPTPFNSAPSSSTVNGKPELPANDLLPPLQDFVQHDIATTQGPPIYYEWKVPSNGLEPPILEAPIGVDGREYPELMINYNNISSSGGFAPTSSSFSIDQPKNSFANNPFLSGLKRPTNNDISTTRTPTSRSIKETAQPNSVSKVSSSKTTTRSHASTSTISSSSSDSPSDITKLRKDLSVPEYAFPLENIGRTGYLSADTYNSFQLKIPERRIDTDGDHQHWFGENPKCPECHPSYVIPGTCAPCLRR